ncbi:hypothetical protein GRF29_69g1966995 [Pseudopithomyces chartarum]|uniref:Uncharacterized protein n=1 Tax=Pseudopithomyces chartarum TaxID=1892770 RepID=A0AAN6M1P2_9PLEO|nr:hypothetical protein GRF29_69g1966995 [Pseudopithomyces chartarum]
MITRTHTQHRPCFSSSQSKPISNITAPNPPDPTLAALPSNGASFVEFLPLVAAAVSLTPPSSPVAVAVPIPVPLPPTVTYTVGGPLPSLVPLPPSVTVAVVTTVTVTAPSPNLANPKF